MEKPGSGDYRGAFYQLAAAMIFLGALALADAHVEAGMNDDWSFIFSARELAASGHLRYNAWSAPLIGLQAYWAALFFKLFGFSFFVARASVWALAMLSIPIIWRILRFLPLSEAQSWFALISFLLSPLVLPHAATFMTDLPAFFLFAGALLCALKAWQADSEDAALRWMAAATICGMLSGSVRQIYWLSGICFVAVLGLARVRSARGRIFAGICIASTVLFGYTASTWLAQQPYVPVDNTLQQLHRAPWRGIMSASVGDSLRNFTGMAVLLFPLTLPLALRQFRKTPLWFHCAVLVTAVVLPSRLAEPMPWLGNTLTNYGVIMSGTVSLGDKAIVLSDDFMIALAAVGIGAMLYALRSVRGVTDLRLKRFLWLTLPFLFLYTAVIVIRAPAFGLFDRYLIPHLFVMMTVLLTVYAGQRRDVPVSAWMTGAVLIFYAVATTHDYFAEARAKLQATDEVLRGGNARTDVVSGFEFDCWTQAELTGHVNNEHVKFPPDAYRQVEDCSGPDDTLAWWRTLAPGLAAHYAITLTHIDGLESSRFPPVEYRRWLPPGGYRVLVEQVVGQEPPLTCKPDPDKRA